MDLSCTVVTPHTLLHCLSPPGAGSGYSTVITVDGQDSVTWTATALAYKPPVITRVWGDGAFGGPTDGGSRVFVSGQQLGPATLLSSVTGVCGRRFVEARV